MRFSGFITLKNRSAWAVNMAEIEKALITGGAGFVGSNLADWLLSRGKEVVIYDDLSRKGVRHNLEWLKGRHNGTKKLEFVEGDISRPLKAGDGDIDAVYHLAAQVAVTSSVAKPVRDFEINALGTINALEFTRKIRGDPAFVYTSTNKVYGSLSSVPVVEKKTRYEYKSIKGVDEKMPLNPCTPYGCSKAAGDVYVQDYFKSYGVKTVTFRMSCIYGPRQFGTVDQGWMAHFIMSALLERPLTVYGDGKQVRDILFISDLVNAFMKATKDIEKAKGKVYNMGGGRKNTISVLELVSLLERLRNGKIKFTFDNWRPSDQKAFYCDTGLAKRDLGWEPEVERERGINMLHDWIAGNTGLF